MDLVSSFLEREFGLSKENPNCGHINLRILTEFPREKHVFEGNKSKGYKIEGYTNLAMISFNYFDEFVAGTVYDYNDGKGLRYELHRYFEVEKDGHIRIAGSLPCGPKKFIEVVNGGK
jgi:hypothetical protein